MTARRTGLKELGGIPHDALLLSATTFAFISATNIMTPLLPDIRDDFGVSIATAGLIVGSYGLARLIIDLPAGFLAHRVGHRRLSKIAIVLLVASSMLGYWAGSVEMLIASRIVSGVSAGALATILISALAATAQSATRGRVMSMFGLANNAGIAVYPIVGGLVGAVAGWRPTFLITAVLAAGAGVLLLRLLTRVDLDRDGGRAGGADSTNALAGRPKTVAVIATNFGVVAMMIHRAGVRNTILPLYAAAVLGLGGVSIATAIALMAITGLVVATPGAMAGDRFGRRRVIIAGLSATAAGDLALLLTHDLTTLLVVAVVVGLGDFFTASQTAMLTEMVPAAERTQTLSGYRFASDLGAMIGPIILAATMDAFDAKAAIILGVTILAVAAVVAYIFVPARVDPVRIRRANA